MEIALYILAAFVFFILLPSVAITLFLFSRKNTFDFDERIGRGAGPYKPFMDRILSDMAWMRSQTSEKVSVTAPDGVVLKGDLYRAGTNRTAILMHGFCATPLNNFSTIGRAFIERGYNVLLVWQRAHGESGGKGTTLGLTEKHDLIRWIELTEKLVPGGDIVLYGISMGGATVAYASDIIESPSVRSMIIDCCYNCPYDQMYKGKGIAALLWAPIMPFILLFTRLFFRVDIRDKTYAHLEKTDIPAVFICGLADRKVPPKLFLKNHERCSSKKLLIEVPGAPHALAFTAADNLKIEDLFLFVGRSLRSDQE